MPETIPLVSGLVELLLSFVLGILVAFGAFRLFARLTKDLDEVDEIRKNNVAVAVVLVSMVVSTALVARAAIYPVIGALQSALVEEPGPGAIAALALRGVAYVLLSFAGAVGAIATGTKVFLRLTGDIDELAELKRGNVAVAIVLAGFLLVMGLFLARGVESLLTALMPDPAFGRIEVHGLGR